MEQCFADRTPGPTSDIGAHPRIVLQYRNPTRDDRRVSGLLRIPSAEQFWWFSATAFLIMFMAMWVLSLVDTRSLDEANVWAKPMKFSISLALHLATLAFVMHFLSASMQTNAVLMGLAVASVIAAIGELGYITIQAARMEVSHFNVGTPFHAAMYSLMAFGAVVLVVASGGVGLAAAVDGDFQLSAPVRQAVAIGLIGGTILTLITAFRLGDNMSHHIGIEAEGARRMPVTGWSLSVGDLRPAHFLATHMMQAVPAFGMVAARVLPPAVATVSVLMAAAAWIAATLVVYLLGISGQPLTMLGGK